MSVTSSRFASFWWWGTVLAGAALGYFMLLPIHAGNNFAILSLIAAPFVHGAAVAYTISKSQAAGPLGILGAVILSSVLLMALLLVTLGKWTYVITTAMPIWLAFSLISMFLGKSLAGIRR